MHSTGIKRLIAIFMQRDGLSYAEAVELVGEVRSALDAALMEEEDPEEVFTDLTGLEPDYIMDII